MMNFGWGLHEKHVSRRDLGLHFCAGRESGFPFFGVLLVFRVFSEFLLCEFAFQLSKPEKERERK